MQSENSWVNNIFSSKRVCRIMSIIIVDMATSRKQWSLQIQKGRGLIQRIRVYTTFVRVRSGIGYRLGKLLSRNLRNATTRGLGYLQLLEVAGKHLSHQSA